MVLSAPLTHDPEAMIPPNWFKQLANIHLKLADYGGQDHFDNFKLSRQLMEKFVRYRYVFIPSDRHPYDRLFSVKYMEISTIIGKR